MKVLIGILLAWAAAWFVVLEFAPSLWIVAALGFAQNLAFTFVSRGRNSGSLVYHMVASIFSNGIWLGMFVIGVKIVDSAPAFPTAFAIVYVLSTMSGSVFAHFLARKVERGAARNVQEDQLQALSRRVRELEDRDTAQWDELETYRKQALGTFRHVQDLHVGLDNHVQAHHSNEFSGLLNGLHALEARVEETERQLSDPGEGKVTIIHGTTEDRVNVSADDWAALFKRVTALEIRPNGPAEGRQALKQVHEIEERLGGLDKDIAALRQDVRGEALVLIKQRLGKVEKDLAAAVENPLVFPASDDGSPVEATLIDDGKPVFRHVFEKPDEFIERRVGEILDDTVRRIMLRIEAIEKQTKKVPGLVKGYGKLRKAYLSEDWTGLQECDVNSLLQDDGTEGSYIERLEDLETIIGEVRKSAADGVGLAERIRLLEDRLFESRLQDIETKVRTLEAGPHELEARIHNLSEEVARIAGRLVTLPMARLRRLETWGEDVSHKLDCLENRMDEYADADWAAEIEEKVSKVGDWEEHVSAQAFMIEQLRREVANLDQSIKIHGDWHVEKEGARKEIEVDVRLEEAEANIGALGRVLRRMSASDDIPKVKRAVAGLHVRVKRLEGRD